MSGCHVDTTLINILDTPKLSKPRSWPPIKDGQLKVKVDCGLPVNACAS